MDSEPIRYYNRYSGQMETEAIFGERFLRWTYETRSGRTILEAVVKRALFSKAYGWWMSRPRSRRSIGPFIEAYGLDVTEFAEPVGNFQSFNDFFARRLRPGVRPVAADSNVGVFPADGRHLGIANIGTAAGLYAKGQQWDLEQLLGSRELAAEYDGGSAIISRLCPTDYHCFHFPVPGTVIERATPVAGPLYSVSPLALRRNINYLWRNKCARTVIDSQPFGKVLIVEVGATCVGSIIQSDYPEKVDKGALKGWFLFGGSCVITLFQPNRVQLAADLLEHTAKSIEVYARCGDSAVTARTDFDNTSNRAKVTEC